MHLVPPPGSGRRLGRGMRACTAGGGAPVRAVVWPPEGDRVWMAAATLVWAVTWGTVWAAAWEMLATPARAEFPQPRLTAIHPPGAQRGTTVEATVVGTDLDGLEKLDFMHPGIVATPVMTEPTEFDPEPRPVPGRMRIEVAADVPPGPYDAVAIGRFGVSNPRLFMIGTVPEIVSKGNNDTSQTAVDVPTDATVSGVVRANVADHYAVDLAAGQRIHVEVWARRIDSRLTAALAVLDPAGRVAAKPRRLHGDDPWISFTAREAGRHVIRVHDMYMGGGDEMPYRLTITTGPVVESVFPPAAAPGGTVRLTAIGRGLPNSGPAQVVGGAEGLEEVAVDAQLGRVEEGATGRFTWRMLAARDGDAELVDAYGGVLDAAPVPPAVLAAETPVTVEREPNDDPLAPQPISLPAAVAGRFHPRGDRDWLSFEAKAGDAYMFDLHSHRLGLPTDASLLVESVAAGADGKPVVKEIAFADDGPAEFPGSVFDRPSLDPAISFKAPADGTYRVLVRELAVDSRAGVDRMWVLEVRRPDPGFQLVALLAQPDRADPKKTLRMVPSLAVGGSAAVDVLVIRRDGFTGEIALEAEGLPAGVTAHSTVVPANASRGVVVLTAADAAQPCSGSFRIVGRGKADDEPVSEVARVASLCWNVDNANTPTVLREAHEIPLAVTADVAPLTVVPQEAKLWEATRGGGVKVPLTVVRRAGAKGGVTLTAAGLPAELKVAEVKLDEKDTAATVSVTAAAKLPVGTYTVLLKGVSKLSYARNPQAAERAKADAARITALAKERAAQATAAREALAAMEKEAAGKQPDGQPAATDLQARKAAAAAALKAAEAAAQAAEQERVRREEAAKAAVAASAPKDIDVPLVIPPITVVVTEPKPSEPPQPSESPKSGKPKS